MNQRNLFSIIKFVIVLVLSMHVSVLSAQNKLFTLVIDAGHGGHDSGAVGKISREKDINLAVVQLLGKMISENYNDVRVVYTRTSDRYLTLQERANVVNSNHADLFISIHTNAAPSSAAFGTETFTLGLAKSKGNLDVAMRENAVMLLEDDYKSKYKGFDPRSVDSYIMFEFMQDKYIDRSISIASDIQNQFKNYAGRSNRGVRQAGFWVLYQSACPSVLVELGFISNPPEEQYLASSRGQKELAESLCKAFKNFKYELDKKSGKVISSKSSRENDTSKTSILAESSNQTETNEASNKLSNTSTVDTLPKVETKSKSRKSKSKDSDVRTEKSQEVAEKSVLNVEQVKSDSGKSASTHQVPQVQSAPKAIVESSAVGVTPKPSVASKPSLSDKQSEQNAFATAVEKPVYKLQLFASPRKLNSNAADFKGIRNADFFVENGMYKYTIGSDTNYEVISKLRKEMLSVFPKAFIISFVGKKKISINEALKLTNKK